VIDGILAARGDTAGLAAVFLVVTASTVLLTGWIRGHLQRLQMGQRVREDGPRLHLEKAGTPTMGGLALLVVTIVVALLTVGRDPAVVSILLAFTAMGIVGALDDRRKVILNRPLGLKGRTKLLAQLVVGGSLGAYLAYGLGQGTVLIAPRGLFAWDLGVAYPLFGALLMAATTNAVNLTDGLDGLATGAVALAVPVFVFAAFSLGALEIGVLGIILLGACVGFLWHNFHPARIFMGDTGSLALGGALAGLAMATGTELLLLFAGGLFVVETLSVIVQVGYFHRTGGKRLLRMSPLHHHLELCGLNEMTVVLCLWGLQGLCVLAAVWGLGGMLL